MLTVHQKMPRKDSGVKVATGHYAACLCSLIPICLMSIISYVIGDE